MKSIQHLFARCGVWQNEVKLPGNVCVTGTMRGKDWLGAVPVRLRSSESQGLIGSYRTYHPLENLSSNIKRNKWTEALGK